jgi:Ca2+-binding EF-hand superfamily protein
LKWEILKVIKIQNFLDPLIALGLVDNREEVQNIVLEVDEDDTGKIEFDEFLGIL